MWWPEMEVWGRWMMIGGDLVVICGDWWWWMVGLDFSEGGRREGWFVGCGNDGVKMMGCKGRDLNKSREAGYPVCERSHSAGRSFARRAVACACACAAGDERSSSGAWRVSERSPKEVRSFASSVSAALLRALRRTIAQGGAIVRFISVFSTFWRTYANVCSLMGERSLPQCAKYHYARVKLKKHKIKNRLKT
jgi:hypothetical protein